MDDKTHVLRAFAHADGPRREGPPTEPLAPGGTPPVRDDLPTLASDTPILRPAAYPTPVVFPGYEITGELGRGGMGVVYRARQRSLNRPVALKVIIAGPHASEQDKARFRVEAEAGARLHHPNIVEVYDVGEHAGFSYIALELIDGKTLRQWQNGVPTDPHLAAGFMVRIARAVQHAHDNGIVHRDLKPANILLAGFEKDAEPPPGSKSDPGYPPDPRPVPKVTDFGLAKPMDGADLTVSGIACGTPNYMAPEQVRGGPTGSRPAVDIWGVGAVLFELLTGRPPFTGTDAVGVMERILRTDPPAVHKVVPGIPRDLAVIVAKCLEKDPGRRYLTARDAADDLDRFLARRPILARPVGVLERGWRWVCRNPVPTAFLAVSTAGCVLTGALAVALAESEADERRALSEAHAARVAAEAARDDLRDALTAARAARAAADAERAAAVAAGNLALEQKSVAEAERLHARTEEARATAERTRAEANLKLAHSVIRETLAAFSRDPRFEGPAFADFRNHLLTTARKFRNEAAAHAGDSVQRLDDLAGVSHWLGFLEFLNDNQEAAAAEYLAAAAAACRWAAVDPEDPEARARMADALMNAGNALYNQKEFDRAVTCYRDATALMDRVLADFPRVEKYHRLGIQAYHEWAHLYRTTGRAAESLDPTRAGLAHAAELVRRYPASVENVRTLAETHTDLARTLVRLGKADEAECHLAEAVGHRDRVAAKTGVAKYQVEAAEVALSLAALRVSAGGADRATEEYARAVRFLEPAAATNPSLAPQLAEAHIQAGENHHRLREFPAGEKSFVRAMAVFDEMLKADPKSAPARAGWSRAATARNHLLNSANRHREAAAEWAKLATRETDPDRLATAELFVLQSLLFAGDWKAAAAGAESLAKKTLPPWMWCDLGRVWCVVGRQTADDKTLAPADRTAGSREALAKAVEMLERARSSGLFKEPHYVRFFENHPDFAPVRAKFDPRK